MSPPVFNHPVLFTEIALEHVPADRLGEARLQMHEARAGQNFFPALRTCNDWLANGNVDHLNVEEIALLERVNYVVQTDLVTERHPTHNKRLDQAAQTELGRCAKASNVFSEVDLDEALRLLL